MARIVRFFRVGEGSVRLLIDHVCIIESVTIVEGVGTLLQFRINPCYTAVQESENILATTITTTTTQCI